MSACRTSTLSRSTTGAGKMPGCHVARGDVHKCIKHCRSVGLGVAIDLYFYGRPLSLSPISSYRRYRNR
jgi:hypothetical protein